MYKYEGPAPDVMPIDRVCGIELDEDLALKHEYKGENYYFCCNGCRRIFVKKPKKWSKMVHHEP